MSSKFAGEARTKAMNDPTKHLYSNDQISLTYLRLKRKMLKFLFKERICFFVIIEHMSHNFVFLDFSLCILVFEKKTRRYLNFYFSLSSSFDYIFTHDLVMGKKLF